MNNKLIINGKKMNNVTITDKNGNVAAVICGNGDIVRRKDYKVVFDVGEAELPADKYKKEAM